MSRSAKRTRDHSLELRKKKKRKSLSRYRRRHEHEENFFSGAEDESVNMKKRVSDRVLNGRKPKSKTSKVRPVDDYLQELIRSDWEDDGYSTPPPSPGSCYRGTPSPPPPVPIRRKRKFVIEFKGRYPKMDASRIKRIPGLRNPRLSKRASKTRDIKNPIIPSAGTEIMPSPSELRNLALSRTNTLRNKFSASDIKLSLHSIEQSLKREGMGMLKVKEEDEVKTKPVVFDPQLVFKPAGERRKRKTALQMVDRGTYIAEANIMRAEAAERELSNSVKLRARGAKHEEASKQVINELPPVPLFEWWDKVLLVRPEIGYESAISNVRITSHVDHPEVMRPDKLKPVNVPLPFYLTKSERRKKRRQIRKQKHETLTDEIRLGLREPPEPKLNLENIIRVLGSQAIQDPTSCEAKARASMLKRKMEHELHNEKRRLTGQQKREKKRLRLLEDTSKEVHVALYRVCDLSDGKKRYKVDINASQYNLTGRCIRIKGAPLNLVVVEGGPRGISKYDRLMTKRIKWGDELMGNDAPNNADYCQKVWQGVTRKRNFQKFQMKLFNKAQKAREHLAEFGAAHYWDQVESAGHVAETF